MIQVLIPSQAKKRYHEYVLDPAPQKPKLDLVAKLRASMNPGVQSVVQRGLPMGAGTAQTASPSQTAPSQAQSMISQSDQLDVLDEVIAEIENEPKNVMAPQAQPQAQPDLQPQISPQQPVVQAPAQAVVPTSEPSSTQAQVVPPAQVSVPPQLPPQQENNPVLAQALPTAVTQVADQQQAMNLNPPAPVGPAGKEKREATSPDQGALEAAQAIQYVEQEPNPEIPPEVDGFLKRAEDQTAQVPQEIVIADGSVDTPVENTRPSQPVVVVPITKEIEKKGEHKGTKFSVRWLVEWSRKIMKKFVGKVIYREV